MGLLRGYRLLVLVAVLLGCSGGSGQQGALRGLDGGARDGGPCDLPKLRINEALSDNDGVAVDELGETDDWVELINLDTQPVALAGFSLRDRSGRAWPLPEEELEPGATLVLWADGEPDQGARHATFKLDADGDELVLSYSGCGEVDRLAIPELPVNYSFARLPDGEGAGTVCRYASPGKPNGSRCEPPPPPELPDDVSFAPYEWPEVFPSVTSPLVITELALRPAAYVEVQNQSESTLDLGSYALRIAPSALGGALPTVTDGVVLSWPVAQLAPGARAVVEVTDVGLEPEVFEGVASVFDAEGNALERVPFMRWPEGAVLARVPDDAGFFTFCNEGSPGAPNEACTPLEGRDVGDRVHALRTPNDFSALSEGKTEVGQEGVKFVVDMAAGDTVHLLSARRWALHYTFIREQIYGDPPLDRCDPAQAVDFNRGWFEFSVSEYFRSEGRRFLLGTLVRHANGMHTVEFAGGDAISPAQMRRAFFAVVAHTPNPRAYALRPADAAQVLRIRMIEGQVPIVGPNAPFQDVHYQPLTQTVGYGVLRFVPAEQLEREPLPLRSLVITDAVPNDIPLVEGLITEAFQTPLSHVNVLSRARGTPNMALAHAREDARLTPLLGKLVRLEVGPSDFSVREATPAEADAFWTERTPKGPKVIPPRDLSVRGLVPLAGRGLDDVPALGAKAAQFAELMRVDRVPAYCPSDTVPLLVPERAFAIPLSHYVDHFEASGAAALLTELLDDPDFRADPAAHEAGLLALRQMILEHPVDAAFLREVEAAVRERFGEERVRFRSSSNTEDLPEFNGAGLHTSTSAELGDPKRTVQDALRTVWASLWNTRAFDEREYANLDQTQVAMGVLVHPAHLGEAAQGVAISRNLMHVIRSDVYFIDAQIGEASVVNPAPGVVTEQVLYTWPGRTPEITYLSRSSLTGGSPVLSLLEQRRVACATRAVHEHFRPLLDPDGTNRLFAMQIEFKFRRGTRALEVKQARPQPFGGTDFPTDCREIE